MIAKIKNPVKNLAKKIFQSIIEERSFFMENNNNENGVIKRIAGFSIQQNRGFIFFILLPALAGLIVLFSVSFACFQIFLPPDRRSYDSFEFEVKKGQGVKEIGWALKEQNLIRSPFWFETYVWLKRESSSLKAGKYSLSPSFNLPLIVDALSGGKVILNEARVTLPEGFSLAEIKTKLLEAGVVGAENLEKEKVGDFALQYKFLGEASIKSSLEGFLFPDTYRFKKDAGPEEIVKRFLENFDKKLLPAWREEISRQKKTIYEILTMASIIQGEAGSEAEMPMIASVFYNRLKIGMALESDATVNFATGKNNRQPLLEDLKIKSPYNTYLNKGLPPGPIGNPGEAAIKAAIFPASSNYYYFLHPLNAPAVFSRTGQEHNANRVKYLK